MANKVQSKSQLKFQVLMLVFISFVVLLGAPTWAEEGITAPAAQAPSTTTTTTLPASPSAATAAPAPAEESFEKKFISSNIAISEWFDGVAEGIDLFLAGKKLTNKKNETNVKLESSTFFREDENPSNSGSVNVNLRLPNVEEYWQLKFTDYDESKEKSTAARGNLRKAPRERNYGATVGLFQKLGNIRAAFQPRIGLQDPLRVSHSLAFESVADLEKYRVNPKFEFFGNPDDGTGIFMALNFNFELSKVHSLTVINDGEYRSKSHLYTATNGISIGQVRTKTTSISYNLFFDSNNKVNYHLEGYTASVSWNHLLYKNILDYQITPHVDFLRDRGFAGLPGLVFTVSLNF